MRVAVSGGTKGETAHGALGASPSYTDVRLYGVGGLSGTGFLYGVASSLYVLPEYVQDRTLDLELYSCTVIPNMIPLVSSAEFSAPCHRWSSTAAAAFTFVLSLAHLLPPPVPVVVVVSFTRSATTKAMIMQS